MLYPVTIIMDRYSGTYSGGEWLAFNIGEDEIPYAVGSSDPDEMDFWWGSAHKEYTIGKGDTPNDALKDLYKKMEDNNA